MKKGMVQKIVSVVLLVGVLSCAPTIKNFTPAGDKVTITCKAYGTLVGELVLVCDSCIYVASGQRIQEIMHHQIKSVTVQGYVNTNWVGAVLVFEVIPAVLMGTAAAQVEEHSWGTWRSPFVVMAALSIPAVVNTLIFSAGTPRAPRVKAPISIVDLEKLKKYARFPQGLTYEQLERYAGINRLKIQGIHYIRK